MEEEKEARSLDMTDEQPCYADHFVLPTNGSIHVPFETASQTCAYLCGNSLGAMPKRSAELVKEELDIWGTHAVEGHFFHPKHREWRDIADKVNAPLARLIGAHENEVACMGTLTSNLHLMMNTFYKPAGNRYKILCEAKAFPSDQYAFASQAILHGFDPKEAILEIHPRPGEYTLRESDMIDTINREGSTIALVLFSGVQYYTGQFFPVESVTRAAHVQGCICGWDLAHAIGNVPLRLHAWHVDFAVWCSYKYLNSGPGGIGGLFIHESWEGRAAPKYAGWWGHDPKTRFMMPPDFSPIRGAQGFVQSNPSVLAIVSLLGSLQVIEKAGGIIPLRNKSVRLTAYLDRLLRKSTYFREKISSDDNDPLPRFTILTPIDAESRGAQLSLLFFFPVGVGGGGDGGGGDIVMSHVLQALKLRGVIGDERQPDVIRLAPSPLYNTFEDCRRAVVALEEAFVELITQ